MTAVNKQVERYGNPNFVEIRVDHAQAICKGEMLKLTIATGLCVPVTGASDNDTLYAIADQAHAAVTVDDNKVHIIRGILINPNCVFEFPLNGAPSPAEGTGLSIFDSQTLQVAATDHVALSVERKTSATTCKVVFLVPPLFGGASQNTSFESV